LIHYAFRSSDLAEISLPPDEFFHQNWY